jgi:hypothetical protein
MASKRTKTKTKPRAKTKSPTVRLIVSDDKRPEVALRTGMKLEVVALELLGPDLKRIKNIGARLCGGSGTCLALIDVGHDAVVNPVAPAKRGKS